MVNVTLRTNANIKGVRLFMPEVLRDFGKDVVNLFGRSALRRIKYRAPKDTGNLQRNIKFVPAQDNKLTATISVDTNKVPYFYPLEKGWKTHYIPSLYVQMHKQAPGQRMGFVPKEMINQTGGWFRSSSENYTKAGFMKRGMEAAQKDYKKYINESFNKHLK
jgi:hypothetical protein